MRKLVLATLAAGMFAIRADDAGIYRGRNGMLPRYLCGLDARNVDLCGRRRNVAHSVCGRGHGFRSALPVRVQGIEAELPPSTTISVPCAAGSAYGRMISRVPACSAISERGCNTLAP